VKRLIASDEREKQDLIDAQENDLEGVQIKAASTRQKGMPSLTAREEVRIKHRADERGTGAAARQSAPSKSVGRTGRDPPGEKTSLTICELRSTRWKM